MADDPREALLAVARELIDKRGYLGLSMRTAAAAAGVTPEVARRYYRNRDALFAAALRLPVDPTTAIPTLVAPGLEGMGERLVRFTLDILKDPEARAELVSLARTGVNAGHAAAGLQDFLEKGVVDRVASMIGVPDARMRSALITSYLLGIAMTRYGVRLEPLSSASEEEVIRMVAPVIQDLLDPRKPLPGSNRNRAGSGDSQPASRTTSRPDAGPAPARPIRTFQAEPAAASSQHVSGPAGSGSSRASSEPRGSVPADRPTGGTSTAARNAATAQSGATRSTPPRSRATGAAPREATPRKAAPTKPTSTESASSKQASTKSASTKSASAESIATKATAPRPAPTTAASEASTDPGEVRPQS